MDCCFNRSELAKHPPLKKLHYIFIGRSLKSVRTELLQQLQNLQGAPSVQMQQMPPPYERIKSNEDEEEDDDKEGSKTKKAHSSELYDKVD